MKKSITLVLGALVTLSANSSFATAQESAPAAQPIQGSESPAASTPAVAPAPEQVSVTAQPPVPETSLSTKVLDAIGAPPEGKGLVVFFRPSKFIGAAVGFIVREGENELGKLRNGNYFTVAAEPGKHAYTVHSESKDVTNIEVDPGETYFLSGSISFGVLVGRPNLSPSDVKAFEDVLPKLKKSAPLNKN